MKEVEVEMADTYSESSHDDDDHYDDEDDESTDGQDEDEPFWKRHCVAIVVAFAATAVSHFYLGAGHPQSKFAFLQPSTSRHAHLDNFARTANISFCDKLPATSSKNRLQLMDFYIPPEHYHTLQEFYQADIDGVDEYDGINVDLKSLLTYSEDSQCLHDMQQQNKRFRGTTYYYQSPTRDEVDKGYSSQLELSRRGKLQQPPNDFTGFAAKFVNLSPKPILLFWDGKGGHEKSKKLVGEIPPFESLGTATMPGQSFHVTPVYDSSTALERWVLTADSALVYFEPNTAGELQNLLVDDPRAMSKYQRQLVNRAFARDYLIASQRVWLGHFPRRFPMHYMHPATFLGQTHKAGDFTLEVVSVSPRVFVIENFLNPDECRSIIDMSQVKGLEHSTLHSGATPQQISDLSTRSSSNTWLPRDTTDLTETIYKRAAQVMALDHELFQKFHGDSAYHHSIAESMQVVHYKAGGEEYQPHHDFVYPSIEHKYQPTRFATLLMYLNTVPDGGETRFPRAAHTDNSRGLEVKPSAGKAVLFYGSLDDGNMDDLSQHGSNPTTDYDKWLANLWIWDPIID